MTSKYGIAQNLGGIDCQEHDIEVVKNLSTIHNIYEWMKIST